MLRENRTAAKALFSLVRMPQSQHGSGKAIKHWRGSCSSPLGLWPLGVVLVFELLSGFLAIECPIDRDAISVGSPVPGAGFRPENPDLAESALPQTLLGKEPAVSDAASGGAN